MKYLRSSSLLAGAALLAHPDTIHVTNTAGRPVDSRIIFINERELTKNKRIFYTKTNNTKYTQSYPKKV